MSVTQKLRDECTDLGKGIGRETAMATQCPLQYLRQNGNLLKCFGELTVGTGKRRPQPVVSRGCALGMLAIPVDWPGLAASATVALDAQNQERPPTGPEKLQSVLPSSGRLSSNRASGANTRGWLVAGSQTRTNPGNPSTHEQQVGIPFSHCKWQKSEKGINNSMIFFMKFHWVPTLCFPELSISDFVTIVHRAFQMEIVSYFCLVFCTVSSRLEHVMCSTRSWNREPPVTSPTRILTTPKLVWLQMFLTSSSHLKITC